MKFEIKDILAIRTAEIEVVAADKGPGITLIIGHNASGKTVLRNCLGAALTGQARLYGISKDDAGRLVREGAEYGFARVCHPNGEGMQVSWNSEGYRVQPKGNPDPVDAICVGWDSPLSLSGRDWVKWLSRVAGVEVAVTDGLRRACPVKNHTEDAIQKIRGLDWDGAAADYASSAQTERKAWAKLTGRPWGANLLGSDNVLHWTHVEYDPKLDLAAAQTELANLKEEVPGHATYSCPSCNLQVRLHQGKLVPAAKEVSPTDDLAQLQARVELLERKVAAAHVTAEARTIAAGAIELQQMAEWLGPGGYRREMLIEALGSVDDPQSLQARLEAITSTMFGDRSALINTDDPDMPVLLGNALEWGTLTWGGDMSSSMLRVRAALQILHAERVNAPCVLIDMLDTLQGPVQQAFFKAIVQHVKVPVVLFATPAGGVLPETDKLAEAGLGWTYVITPDGVVRRGGGNRP